MTDEVTRLGWKVRDLEARIRGTEALIRRVNARLEALEELRQHQ